MINRSRNSARKAILTNIEREYLQLKKPLNPKIKSKLLHKLDERFIELIKDLQIVEESEILAFWKATRLNTWMSRPDTLITSTRLNLLNRIFPPQKVHLSAIRRTKERKNYIYWLDTNPHILGTVRNDNRALEPEFVLRKLGSKAKESFGKVLLIAYLKDKIPTDKAKAITLEEIKKILS